VAFARIVVTAPPDRVAEFERVVGGRARERRGLEESQKLTDKKIKEVDDLLKSKEQEILAV
jgi:ribosome recycling factor